MLINYILSVMSCICKTYSTIKQYIVYCPYLFCSITPTLQKRSIQKSSAMELIYFNLILIIALNILFFVSGICLNSLVIVCFWRSVQLRKKLCYFTIMVLSCCDLLVVLTRDPLTIFCAMLWFSETFNGYPNGYLYTSIRSSVVFAPFSLNALVSCNDEF